MKDKRYIKINSDGYIDFTDCGADMASSIYDKHNVLTNFLVGLGVSKEVATKDASGIEHYLSDETFEAIKSHLSKV